jgi:hypothetical protein
MQSNDTGNDDADSLFPPSYEDFNHNNNYSERAFKKKLRIKWREVSHFSETAIESVWIGREAEEEKLGNM